jgi:hypothetical protein
MGNAVTAWVKQFPRGTFTTPQRFVLRELADLADETYGIAYPSLKYLMKQTELGESTVRKAVAELEEMGVVRREAASRKNGSQTTNQYVLVGYRADAELSEPPARSEPRGGQERGGRGQEVAPQEEPSLDPSSSYEEELATQQKKPARKATRIPATFSVTPPMLEWAMSKGLTALVEPETEKFTLYWASASGRNATKLDWVKTWQVWMLSAAERQPAQARAQVDRQPMKNFN